MTSSPTCSSAPSIAESTSSITLHSPTREQTADSLKDLNNYSHSSTYKQFTDSDDFTELQLSTNTNRRKITSTSLLLQNQIKQLISSHAQKNNRNLNLSTSEAVSPTFQRKNTFDLFADIRPNSGGTDKKYFFNEDFITDLFSLILDFDYDGKIFSPLQPSEFFG